MAATSRKHNVLEHTIRLFSSRSGKEGFGGAPSASNPVDDIDELDESDVVWAYCTSPPAISACAADGARLRNIGGVWDEHVDVRSLPVSVPEWSMSPRNDGEEEEEREMVVPPHLVMWRRRAESFSVVEGIGRTLKGRDISRLRNAVWAKTGFQD